MSLGEAQILTTRGLTGNTAGAKTAKFQAAADQRPMFPRGTTCHVCKCPIQPDSLAVGTNYVHWKRTTSHVPGCTVALKLAKTRAVTIKQAELKQMVPAADWPAFLDTVAAYKIDCKAKTKETKKK